MILEGKVILVTGGTGSFGQKFTEIALRQCNPRVIRIFSRGELLQQEMRQKFNNDPRLRFFIGDVRDRERVYRAMNGVDIVVHAAALKQVLTCEYNPIEAVRKLLRDDALRAKMSKRGRKLVDGKGIERIISEIPQQILGNF